MKRTILAVILAGFASAALAKSPKLSAEQMAEVKKYRADGEALHKAGKHQESVDTLAKAMKILDIK